MTIQIDYEAERKLDIDYETLASKVAELTSLRQSIARMMSA